MKKISYLLALLLTLLLKNSSAMAVEDWRVVMVPASINSDKTLRLISGSMQNVSFVLQASDTIKNSAAEIPLKISFDFPGSFDVVHQGGQYSLTNPQIVANGSRKSIAYDILLPNSKILGAPGARLNTEWNFHTLFVKTPSSVTASESYVTATVQHQGQSHVFRWPLVLSDISPASQRPKRIHLGLWDYSYSRATNSVAATGIAQFLKNAGITYTQTANDSVYRKALQAQGIATGGYTHQNAFIHKSHPDVRANGTLVPDFPDPQGIRSLPAGEVIPGVKTLVNNAAAHNGMATYDYEPYGRIGFSDAAIQAFRQKYGISETDFNIFRAYVVQNVWLAYRATDPQIQNIWSLWTKFRTEQTSAYTKRIYDGVKQLNPNVQILLTTTPYGYDEMSNKTLGLDNAAMAKYTDVIMPQFYLGYGAAETKMIMQTTAGWKKRLIDHQANTQLWPLLMVRFNGASIRNSPQRLYQQSLGSIVNGASGIAYYYPGNMDAPYWEMTARLSQVLATYEDYYLDGKRIDEQFELSGMPQGEMDVNLSHQRIEKIQNPTWNFTAHELNGKVLLTLMNLHDSNSIAFEINTGQRKVVSAENATHNGKNWLVNAGEVAFVVFD